MQTIECSQKLWREVRRWDVASETKSLAVGNVLGPWAATRYQNDDLALVIAVSRASYLTVVFPLSPPPAFDTAFRDAVAAALEDLGVPHSRISLELQALGHMSFEWLRDATMRSVLRDLEMYCGLEMTYHSDLRTVQRNLNDVPHASLAVNVPAVAVTTLFRNPAMPSERQH
jgi:hypothetical protein